MPSMIERVAAAEAEAAKIKKDAAAKGRENIAAANAEAAQRTSRAREEARERLAKAEAEAEKEGEELKKSIIAEKSGEADVAVGSARARLDKAVEHIIERATAI